MGDMWRWNMPLRNRLGRIRGICVRRDVLWVWWLRGPMWRPLLEGLLSHGILRYHRRTDHGRSSPTSSISCWHSGLYGRTCGKTDALLRWRDDRRPSGGVGIEAKCTCCTRRWLGCRLRCRHYRWHARRVLTRGRNSIPMAGLLGRQRGCVVIDRARLMLRAGGQIRHGSRLLLGMSRRSLLCSSSLRGRIMMGFLRLGPAGCLRRLLGHINLFTMLYGRLLPTWSFQLCLWRFADIDSRVLARFLLCLDIEVHRIWRGRSRLNRSLGHLGRLGRSFRDGRWPRLSGVFFPLQPFDLISNLSVSPLFVPNLPCNTFLVSGVQTGDEFRDDCSMRRCIEQPLRGGTGELAFLGVGAWAAVWIVAVLVRAGRRMAASLLDALPHQRSVELLQGLRAEPLRVEGGILADEGVVAQQVRDGGEAGGTGIAGREGLEEEEGLEGRVGRQRRHPPLPVWPATQGALSDGSHGDGGGPRKEVRTGNATGHGRGQARIALVHHPRTGGAWGESPRRAERGEGVRRAQSGGRAARRGDEGGTGDAGGSAEGGGGAAWQRELEMAGLRRGCGAGMSSTWHHRGGKNCCRRGEWRPAASRDTRVHGSTRVAGLGRSRAALATP